MRLDKLTTAFQQALADGQSAAVARENPYVEPAHVLAAMLAQADGPKSLLERAGANTAGLKQAMDGLIAGMPQVQGGGQVSASRDLLQLLQQAEKEAGKRGDEFVASEMFLVAAGRCQDGHRRHRARPRPHAQVVRGRHRRGARRQDGGLGRGRRPARGAEEVHARPDRARAQGQARPGDRAATTRSAARSRCCSGAARTTRC